MNRTLVFAASLAPLCWPLYGRAVVLYEQPHNGSATTYKSAWYAPNGMDGDAWVWDAFTLSSDQAINEIRWRGGYTNGLSGAGISPVYDFTIEFYASIAAQIQPDIVSPPLARYVVGGNAAETSAGTFGGVPMFDYRYTLPTPFQALANTKYWIQIEASQGVTPQYYWPPDWGLAAAGGGDGSHFRGLNGSTKGTKGTNYATISGDAAFSLHNVVPTVNAVWDTNNNGDWSEGGNWNNGIAPNGIGHTATFGAIITAPRTVTLTAPATVGAINFTSPISYTIAGSSTLTLQAADPDQASVLVSAGSQTISAPLALNSDTTFTVDAFNGTLQIAGPLRAAGRMIMTAGQGRIQFENIQAAALNVTVGVTIISPKATANSPAGASRVQSLSFASFGQLDLNNNSMVLDYTAPVGTLVDEVRQHLANWDIYSSLADSTCDLGYGDNARLGLATFAGQPVTADSVLIKYTYLGDTNLDGQVDVIDLGSLATAWQTNGIWTDGDFNYDGFVDVIDLGLLATNWQAGVGAPLGPASLSSALASYGLPTAEVPEPALAGAVGAAMLIRRRRAMPS